jgi:GT2 family glycosyltransferase
VTRDSTISVILPTFRREKLLLDTVRALLRLVEPGDEVLVIDQTPEHEVETDRGLRELARSGAIRWFRKQRPSQCEAMNAGSLLARGAFLLFLDDDIIPSSSLLSAHRRALIEDPALPATTGQVLQPWNREPVASVANFDLRFDSAYDKPCDVLTLMAGNFAVRRDAFLSLGGMDENFRGNNYRNDAELAHRIHAKTGRLLRFVPEASVRHLLAGGGNRAFGSKDSWGAIGGSVGDYYFAMKWYSGFRAVVHVLRRLIRAPLSRYTVARPWLIPMLVVREWLALAMAVRRLWSRTGDGVKTLDGYDDLRPAEAAQ